MVLERNLAIWVTKRWKSARRFPEHDEGPSPVSRTRVGQRWDRHSPSNITQAQLMDGPSPQRRSPSERAVWDIPTQESSPLPAPSEDVILVECQTSEDYKIPGDDKERIPGSSLAARDVSAAGAGVSDAACGENERKKRKISWIYDHVKRLDGGKRCCMFCNKTYGPGSSTGTIISHLKSHNIVEPGTKAAFDSSTARSYL
jgi:hypothetical protein